MLSVRRLRQEEAVVSHPAAWHLLRRSIGDTRFRDYRAAGGIFYTGRTELTLGLELAFNRAPLGTHDVYLSSFLGLIVLRYNFD